MKSCNIQYLLGKCVLAIAIAVSSSTPAHAELIVSPEAVIISGDRPGKLSTTLTLSSDQTSTTLRTAVSDLRRSDGAALIPAETIALEPAEITVPEGTPVQQTITVDLAQATANGEFAGLFYLYHDGGRQVIPVTVKAKAAPTLPWLVMLAGVGLGTLLSIYRVDGRSRDEIIVQVSRLRNQLDSDAELYKDFRVSIESKLVRVSSTIEDQDWETAKIELATAKNLWRRWQEFRDDWIAQLRYSEQLIQENKRDLEAEPPTIFMQGVKGHIDAVYRKLRAGQYEMPSDLSTALSDIRQQFSSYHNGHSAVETLKNQRKKLPEDKQERWLEALNHLETKLDHSNPDQESYNHWQTLLDEAQKKLKDEIANSDAELRNQPSSIIVGRSGMEDSSEAQVPLVPQISVVATPQHAQQAKQQAQQARWNLWWFNQTSRCVAIIFLAWLGMIELYGAKPTFGAEPLRDYFALLAWGFGAEMTRESIARASQNLGVPLVNQSR